MGKTPLGAPGQAKIIYVALHTIKGESRNLEGGEFKLNPSPERIIDEATFLRKVIKCPVM